MSPPTPEEELLKWYMQVHVYCGHVVLCYADYGSAVEHRAVHCKVWIMLFAYS